MHKELTSRFIYSTFLVIAMLLVWALNVNAAHAESTASQLSIAANGQTMIKGAVVVSVEGLVVVVSTTWGATRLVWSVETTGSTKFYPAGPSRDMLKAIHKGDLINVTGILEENAGQGSMRASAVRNLSLLERLAPTSVEQEEEVFPAIPSTGAPREVPASDEHGNSLVVAATSTALLSWLWRYLYGDPTALALQ